ncbi:THAP domain-containing protein 3-like [Zophobas morio]|uniref:THAP domain-containing protein 3-like n=1 Tax=Zophobas morio TaxID=2755281 RepID=UPI0030829882
MTEKRRNKSNNYCCVPMCNTYYSKEVSFHKFPMKNKLILLEWVRVLKIGKKVTKNMQVCNKHFRDEDYFFNRRLHCQAYKLKQNVIPTQNLPKGSHERKLNKYLRMERQRRSVNREKNKKIIICDQLSSNIATNLEEFRQVPNNITYNRNEMETAETLISLGQTNPSEIICTNNDTPKIKEYLDKGVQCNTEKFNKFDVSDIVNSDYKLIFLTEIHNMALLNVMSPDSGNKYD